MASKSKRKTRSTKQAGAGDVDNVALADSSVPGAGATSPNEQVGSADAVGGTTDQGAPGMDQVEQNKPTVPVTAGKRKADNVTPGLQKRQKVTEEKDEDLAAKDGPEAPAGGPSEHGFGAGRGRGTPRGNGRGMPRGNGRGRGATAANGRGRGATAANGSGSGRGTLTPAPAVSIVVPRVAMPNRPPGRLTEAQRQDRIEQLKATTSAILSLADNAHRDAGRRLLRNYSNGQLKEIAVEMKELLGMTAEDLEKLNRPHVKGHPLPETSPSAAEDDADEGDSLPTLSAPGSPMHGVLSELPPLPADPPAAPPSEAKTPLASPSAGPAAAASPAAPSGSPPEPLQPRRSPVPPAGGNPDLSLLVNVQPPPSNPQRPAAPGATAPIPRRSAPPHPPPADPQPPVPPQGGIPAADPPVPAQLPPAADENDGSAPPPAGPQPPVPPQGGVPAADPPVPAQPPPAADQNDGAAPPPSGPEPPSLIPKKPRRKATTSREDNTMELEYASDIDSSEAELVEREQRAKPGPARKEDIARIIAKQREIASWAEEEAERSSKSVDWVHRQLGMQMRLGRTDTSWNIYQEKWSATEPHLEGETPDQFRKRCSTTWKQLKKEKKESQAEGDGDGLKELKEELEQWREEYRSECAKDDITEGNRFKVIMKLMAQLQDITRRFWTHYRIAVVGWVVSTEGTDLSAQAAGGMFANNEFAYKFMNARELDLRKLCEDLVNMIKNRERAASNLEDYSVEGVRRLMSDQDARREAIRNGVRMFEEAICGGKESLQRAAWARCGKLLYTHMKRIENWPRAMRLDEAKDGRFPVSQEGAILSALYQWKRELDAGLEHEGLRIVDLDPETEVKLRQSNPAQFRKIALWTTIDNDHLLFMGDVMDGKLPRTRYKEEEDAQRNARKKNQLDVELDTATATNDQPPDTKKKKKNKKTEPALFVSGTDDGITLPTTFKAASTSRRATGGSDAEDSHSDHKEKRGGRGRTKGPSQVGRTGKTYPSREFIEQSDTDDTDADVDHRPPPPRIVPPRPKKKPTSGFSSFAAPRPQRALRQIGGGAVPSEQEGIEFAQMKPNAVFNMIPPDAAPFASTGMSIPGMSEQDGPHGRGGGHGDVLRTFQADSTSHAAPPFVSEELSARAMRDRTPAPPPWLQRPPSAAPAVQGHVPGRSSHVAQNPYAYGGRGGASGGSAQGQSYGDTAALQTPRMTLQQQSQPYPPHTQHPSATPHDYPQHHSSQPVPAPHNPLVNDGRLSVQHHDQYQQSYPPADRAYSGYHAYTAAQPTYTHAPLQHGPRAPTPGADYTMHGASFGPPPPPPPPGPPPFSYDNNTYYAPPHQPQAVPRPMSRMQHTDATSTYQGTASGSYSNVDSIHRPPTAAPSTLSTQWTAQQHWDGPGPSSRPMHNPIYSIQESPEQDNSSG
ncbi:hypothetical protein EXIGLDRAFT_696652 [Exidia glandulosa HHB12029]|uniref:Uncharacterized protein n=1 Tax=Exidia glandulosa HHB12029 TaxID=1314781 RepID=A0A165F6T2_EXIGL|nr:hypothetical protein EXIGLDRAFT_696652 [Exidia glandulosa HHB12029]